MLREGLLLAHDSPIISAFASIFYSLFLTSMAMLARLSLCAIFHRILHQVLGLLITSIEMKAVLSPHGVLALVLTKPSWTAGMDAMSDDY